MTDELTTLQGDLQTLLKTVYKHGNSATEEELDAIAALLGRIAELRTQLGLLQDDSVQALKNAYIRQTTGNGDDETLGQSMGYAQATYEQRVVDAKARYAKQVEDANTAYAALVEAGADQATLDSQGAKMAQAAEVHNAELQAALDERAKMYNDIWDGLEKQNPEDAQKLKDVSKIIDTINKTNLAYENNSWSDDDLKSIFTDENLAKYAQGMDISGWTADQVFDNLGSEELQGRAKTLYEQMVSAMNGLLDSDSEEGNPFGNALQAMIDKGIDLETIDWTQADGTLADAMRLHLLQEDGMDALGSEAMSQIGSGITEGESLATGPAETAASDISAALGISTIDTGSWISIGGQIGAAIEGGAPDAIRQAWALRNLVEQILGGTTVQIPGWNSFNAPTHAGGDGLINPNISSTINVTLPNARIDSNARMAGLAAELAAYQRRDLAGVGVLPK